jgi:surface polysaccharide O-acyltransferase-like enzyme
MSKERILYLDVIRIFACVLIIMMHAPIPDTGLSSYVLSSDSLMTAPGVGLFIMVSGALLLPVKMETKVFLKKRLVKILIPALFWTLVYMSVFMIQRDLNFSDLTRRLISIPFSAQFNGVLWFIYMLIGLYLLAPIISPWLEKASKKEIEMYLGIWAVTLCYPLIRNVVAVNESTKGILYYFGGYAGYFLLGYYLRRYTPSIPLGICCMLIILPVAVGAFCKLQGVDVDFFDVFYYLSILTVGAAVGWFVLLQRFTPVMITPKKSNIIVLVSNCCFGIYLSHIFVMRTLLWHCEFLRNMGGITQILTTTFLTFVGSLIMTSLLSRLSFGDFLVGYKQRHFQV